jgi:hypothetical protein
MGLSQAKYSAPWTSKINRSKGLGFIVTQFFVIEIILISRNWGKFWRRKHISQQKKNMFFLQFFLKIKKKNIHAEKKG